MNVQHITMKPAEARARLLDYRKHLHTRADSEYEACADAYKELAKGTPLIALSASMAAAGWDEQGRPKLAIARADRKRVVANINPNQIVFNSGDPGYSQRAGTTLTTGFRREGWPARPTGLREHWQGKAMVPLIPADVRPTRCDLTKHHIIWEADWEAVPIDPLLIRHVGGDLWAVIAEWNLTEVERAVIGVTRAA